MSASKLAEKLKARSDAERLEKNQARAAAEELYRAAVLREVDREPDADDPATDAEIAELEAALETLGKTPDDLLIAASQIKQAIAFSREFSDEALAKADERRKAIVGPALTKIEDLKAEIKVLEAEISRADSENHNLRRRRQIQMQSGIRNIRHVLESGFTHDDIDDRFLQIADDQIVDSDGVSHGEKRRDASYRRQQESQAKIDEMQRQERVAAAEKQRANRPEREEHWKRNDDYLVAQARRRANGPLGHDPYADGAA